MNVNPIGAAGVNPAAVTSPTTSTGTGGRVDSAGGAGFGESITRALDELDRLHGQADKLATEAATGDLDSVTDYLVAATEAQLATQVTAAVRNRAVEAFNDIMRMPV